MERPIGNGKRMMGNEMMEGREGEVDNDGKKEKEEVQRRGGNEKKIGEGARTGGERERGRKSKREK